MGEGGVDRLRLLATAIAGRALEVADAGRGEPAWTDGTTAFVDAHADPADQVRMVAVQAALLAAGSLEAGIVHELTRRPALARRYLAVEGRRALTLHEDLLPGVVRALIEPRRAAGIDSAAGALAVARSRRPIEDPPAVFGVIRPRRLVAWLERADAEAPKPGWSADRELRPNEAGLALDDLDDLDRLDDDPRRLGHLLSSPVGGEGVLGRVLRRLLSPVRAPSGGGPAGGDRPTHVGQARRGRGGMATPTWAEPGGIDGGAPVAPFSPQVTTYPEWDVRRGRYRPAWCTVHEREPRPQDLAPMAMPDGQALRRPLARLGTGLVGTRRRPQGDDVDIDAVVASRVEALAGSPPDEAVYVESLRRRRDLAVLVLLDVSGSAGEAGPAGRTVHEHQRAAAAALTTALHDLGDRVALHAFSSQGRRAVHVTRVKGFDDRLDGHVVRRLGGLVPRSYTRLGAAIRHGGAVVERDAGTTRRLLLVVSDGLAYDHGYEGPYAEADARRALAEVRRRGTGCLCLSVGAGTGPATLRRVFGPAAHATVATADDLPALVGPLFRRALRSAEAQRRSSQRHERARARAHDHRRTA